MNKTPHVLTLLLSTLTLHAMATPLEIAVEDDAAPWSMKDGSGYANDLVEAAFKAVQIEVKLKVMPYARCKRLTEEGKSVACFSMSWEPDLAGKISFSAKPLFICRADYFQNINKPLPVQHESDLRKPIIVGSVIGYEYPESTLQLAKKGVIKFEPTRSEDINLKKLALGRIDATLINHNQIKSAEVKLGLAGVKDRVAYAFSAGTLSSYIGFSELHPQGRWAREQFDRGFRLIIDNGVAKQLEKKWTEQTPNE